MDVNDRRLVSVYDGQALNRFDSNSFDRTQQSAAIQPSNPTTCILPQDVGRSIKVDLKDPKKNGRKHLAMPTLWWDFSCVIALTCHPPQ